MHDFLLENVHIVHILQERFVCGQHLHRLDVLLQLLHVALQLGPSVLEPGDDL